MKFAIYLLERFKLMMHLIDEIVSLIFKINFRKSLSFLVVQESFLSQDYFPKPRGRT